jgi:O-antigen/teichoic acid export membrane protein
MLYCCNLSKSPEQPFSTVLSLERARESLALCEVDQNTRSGEPAPPAGNSISTRALGRVVGRASWAFVEQALFSSSNFATNLILALWMSPTAYGGYMAATATFWVTVSVHDALLIQPMMVFGSVRFHHRPKSYLAVLMVFHWCISAIFSVALGVCGLCLMFWGARSTGSGLLGYAAAAPLVNLLWLARRKFYIWLHPRLAAGACAIYVVAMFAILFALYRSGLLSSFTAPLAVGGASALAIAAMTGLRRFELRSSARADFLREVAAAHWRYGRWAVLTGVAGWARGGLYYLVVPVLAGLEANAALNVLSNLVLPAVLMSLAATPLLVPAFSRARRDPRAAPLMWAVFLVAMAGASLYALLVALFGGTLIDLVYRGRYTQYADLAWLIGLIILPTAASTIFAAFLRAHERPDRELWAHLYAAAVTCFGIVAIAAWGLPGAIIGSLASAVTTMLVMFWAVLRTGHGTLGHLARPGPSLLAGARSVFWRASGDGL